MAVRGLKETKDIDLFLSKDFIEKLRTDNSWKYHPRIIPTEEAGLANNDGTIELYPTIGGIHLNFEDMKTREEIIDGIPFADLHDILTIKETYKREKDLKDIELIKRFLSQ